MTTATVALTTKQIHENIMEDAREYQDKQIEELTDQLGATYLRTFMHTAIIAHWATLFREPVSTMLTNLSATLSIAIPAAHNLDPPPIFPTASGSGMVTEEPELEYPAKDDDWKVQSVDDTPALPILPPHHEIYLEVLDHLHTLHIAVPTPPMHELGPNREPITPTNPVPSMPSSPPLFLQVDPLDAAPSFADVVNALVQHDVNAQITRIVQEEEEERRTPSPTSTQPGIHPGPGWHANFKEAAIHYMFRIPSDAPQRFKIAPFIMINWDTTSPKLLRTCSRGCPVHTKHLHACADEFPCPAFDHHQEFFFTEHQTHSDGVDWAMQQEGDDTLQAEVVRNCAAHARAVRVACRVADAREQLADKQFMLLQSTCRLAHAKTYHCLCCHITNTLTLATSTLSLCHIHRIKEAVDSPCSVLRSSLVDCKFNWNWTGLD